MYSAGWAEILSIGLLIWLIIISYLFWREKSFLSQLFPKGQERDIRQKFKELLERIDEFEKRGQNLAKGLNGVRRDGLTHIQRTALLRYNPYGDTGGEQSFTLVFLDGKDDGLVLTSLHSRAGTRVYAKPILGGRSEIELSKEEKLAIIKAVDKKEYSKFE